MSIKLKVLYLPKWYPNRFDSMAGLFIQRQAEAISATCQVVVVYAHPAENLSVNYSIETTYSGKVLQLICYYRTSNCKLTFFNKISGNVKHFIALRKTLKHNKSFQADIIHIHIFTRLAIIGLLLKWKCKSPLVISEHWSRYFPENDSYRGVLRKMLTSFTAKKANAVIAVSSMLRQAMLEKKVSNSNFQIVANVVDSSVFNITNSFSDNYIKTIIHVSCFDDASKNISGFLQSLKQLSELRQDFKCLLIGEGIDFHKIKQFAGELKLLGSFVFFSGLKTSQQLAALFNSSDFSVVSSRYETFCTVIVESLSCGIPVVSTLVGVAPQLINEQTGMLVPVNDDVALCNAMNKMLNKCRTYNKNILRSYVENDFSSERIGNQLCKIYSELLENTN